MNKPIKIGVVGLGRAGAGFHIPDMENMTDKYQVVAVCDIIPERTAEYQKRLSCRGYATLEELLADDEIEMVDIVTRSCDHYAHALKVIAAGKDLMLEKPVCMNDGELADLLSKTNKPGCPKLYMRHNRRFEPAFAEMKKIVDSGILGNVFELQLSECGYQWRDDWQTISEFGGGQMLNWGPHLIDHALQFLGAPVARMHTDSIQAVAGGDCEDHFSIRLTAENGRFATVSVSGSAAFREGRKYVAIGTRGQAVMLGEKIHLTYIDPEMALPEVVSDPGTPGASFGSSGTFESALKPKWVEEDRVTGGVDHKIVLEHIYQSYRNGVEYPIKDEEILALMNVIATAKKQTIVKAKNI